jgi:hypothetical protein
MCKEPINPNLPHWRRPSATTVAATPLTGDELVAARRTQAAINIAYLGEGSLISTESEIEDWSIYDSYWNKVRDELIAAHTPDAVTPYDVTESVRKRLI